jgi:hypothetical protein
MMGWMAPLRHLGAKQLEAAIAALEKQLMVGIRPMLSASDWRRFLASVPSSLPL